MAIHGSYERHPDLGLEAVVFIDPESGACFQIMRDLLGPRSEHHSVSTGASAPVPEGVIGWRRVEAGQRFEFELVPQAGRLFGEGLLSFVVEPVGEESLDELADHVERLLR